MTMKRGRNAMNVGKALRIVRAAKTLSQKQLANKVGLDASYISMIETGKRVPSMEVVETIAKGLRIPLYLLVLLGSSASEMKGLSSKQGEEMGKALLSILIGFNEETT
jgi:transcriptional regulator with XRE-family HTH domain